MCVHTAVVCGVGMRRRLEEIAYLQEILLASVPENFPHVLLYLIYIYVSYDYLHIIYIYSVRVYSIQYTYYILMCPAAAVSCINYICRRVVDIICWTFFLVHYSSISECSCILSPRWFRKLRNRLKLHTAAGAEFIILYVQSVIKSLTARVMNTRCNNAIGYIRNTYGSEIVLGAKNIIDKTRMQILCTINKNKKMFKRKCFEK